MAMPLRPSEHVQVPGRLMTLSEFVSLPEDNRYRYELQEGVLVVSPRALRKHQLAAYRLARQIDDQLSAEWETVLDMEVVVHSEDPAIVRVPDLVVTRVGGPEARLAPSDVLLAVEVISPESRNVDTRLKPFEYADAGIPHYWVVDLDPPAPSITVFHLASREFGYVESPAVAGELATSAPLSLRIDIPALVAERSAAQ
jgi:Uma2 family endonuclease